MALAYARQAGRLTVHFRGDSEPLVQALVSGELPRTKQLCCLKQIAWDLRRLIDEP